MIEIDWEEYKFYKKMRYQKLQSKDNFDILIEFLKYHYKLTAAQEIFETIKADETGAMMLKKENSQRMNFLKNIFLKI